MNVEERHHASWKSDYGGGHTNTKQSNPLVCLGVPLFPIAIWPSGGTTDALDQSPRKAKPKDARIDESSREPRTIQESPVEPRRAWQGAGETRRIQEIQTKRRRTKESPRGSRRAQKSAGEPRESSKKQSATY